MISDEQTTSLSAVLLLSLYEGHPINSGTGFITSKLFQILEKLSYYFLATSLFGYQKVFNQHRKTYFRATVIFMESLRCPWPRFHLSVARNILR